MRVMEAELTTIAGSNGAKIVSRTRGGLICRSGGLLRIFCVLSENEREQYKSRFSLQKGLRTEHDGLSIVYLGNHKIGGFEISITISAQQARKLFDRDDLDAIATLLEDRLVRILRK